jgi:hypothetical protein
MAHHVHSGDQLIDQADHAEEEADGREARAANLFDIRRIIGGLFLLYGMVLVVLGFGASDADLRRAHGINVNLSVGTALLVVAVIFIAWALLRPLGRVLEEEAAEPADDAVEAPRFTRDREVSRTRVKQPG